DVAARRHVREDDPPRVGAVTAFDLAVRPRELLRLGRAAVMLHERMLADRLVSAPALERPRELGPLVDAPLDEDREERDRRLPGRRGRALSEEVAVASGGVVQPR